MGKRKEMVLTEKKWKRFMRSGSTHNVKALGRECDKALIYLFDQIEESRETNKPGDLYLAFDAYNEACDEYSNARRSNRK